MKNSTRAFSLVEVMMSLTILSLLAAMIFAAMGPARERARQRVCVSNLRQIGQAIAMYQADYDGIDIIPGQPTPYWQLGLPGVTMGHDFRNTYIKNQDILICPNDTLPRSPTGFRISYYWQIIEDVPDYWKFSNVVARRGGDTPLLVDEWHNSNLDISKAPRWATKRVIVLRLNQQVQVREVPVRTTEY